MTTTATLMPPAVAGDAPREYRWAADDFKRACESGAFGHDRRLELIHGRVIEHRGQGPLHSALAAYIADCLRAALSPHYTVREERAIRISFDGEPIPDVSVVTGKNLDYLGRHPAPDEAVLLVEVAISSEEYDLGSKALLYAQAGITDYWVVLPERQQVIVHRDPSLAGYVSVMPLGVSNAVSPLAAQDVTLAVRDLLGLSEQEDSGENIMTTVVAERATRPTPDTGAEAAPQPYLWTVEALHRSLDAGVFAEPSRIELIHGRVIDRMSQGPLYRSSRVRLGRLLRAALEPLLLVVEECTLPVAFDGEPVADVAVLYGPEEEYDRRNPSPADTALLVEIAVSSEQSDLGEKALLYAQAGVTDYWVALPMKGQVVVHRNPSPDGYRAVTRLAGADTLSPLAVSTVVWTVGALLGREEKPEDG